MLEVADIGKEVIKIKGVEYQVDSPSVGQVQMLNKGLKAAEESSDITAFDALIDFLASLGFDRAVLADLKIKQLQAITEYLSGAKKN